MITIKISKPNKIPGLKAAFISMDKYNESCIDNIRNLSTRVYDPETKIWEIPLNSLEQIINNIVDDEITLSIENNAIKKSTIPDSYKFKTQPYEYQLDGIEYGLSHTNFILGDEPGLGKTLQVINIASILKYEKKISQALIICCVNSVKYNWEKEIKLHCNESCKILGIRARKNGNRYIGSMEDKIYDVLHCKETFLITNIETLRNDDFIKALKKNKNINFMAADETHLAKNHTCQMGKNFQKLSYIPNKVAMTGTPIINKPLDAYAILKLLGVEKSNYKVFKGYYCRFGGFNSSKITGYKNLDTLKESLKDCMIRRLKDEVLHDLPQKIIQNDFVEMDSAQSKIYNEARQQVLNDIDLISESNNPLSKLLRMRQATGYTGILSSEIKESCKFDRCEQLIDEILSNNKKVLLFSNWTSITNPLFERLKKYNPILITGEVDTKERQNLVDKFQNDKDCKVCIGSIGALGTGLTLTAASYAIFLDLPWNYALYQQACDRIHRISQKETVNIINLIVKNTIDERILDLIYSKKDMSDILVDGVTKPSKDLLMGLIS